MWTTSTMKKSANRASPEAAHLSSQTAIHASVDRLDLAICAYLALPAFLFFAWFTAPFALLLAGLTGFGFYQSFTKSKAVPAAIGWKWIVGIGALAIAWTAISGVGNFYYANTDWITRGAVFYDLTDKEWPSLYTGDDGRTLVLRAPVGYYLPAATLGKVWDLDAAYVGLLLWTAIGLSLFLTAATRLFETTTQRCTSVLLLLLFGGMDIVGYVFRTGHPPALGENTEWWLQIIQYPSMSYLMAWVPNHALPAWLGTVLIIKHWKSPSLSLLTPGLALAIPLWSPLAAAGLFPLFAVGLAWRRDWKTLFSLKTSFPFLLPAIAIAAYLGMGAATINHGWLFRHFASIDYFLRFYLVFCFIEFGLLVLVLSRLMKFQPIHYVAVATLSLLPFYIYGPYNDLAMRASIPSLTILALASVQPLAAAKRSYAQAFLLLILALGFMGSLQEPIRGLIGPYWVPLNQSLPDVVHLENSAAKDRYPKHYFAEPDNRGTNRFLRSAKLVQNDALNNPAKKMSN